MRTYQCSTLSAAAASVVAGSRAPLAAVAVLSEGRGGGGGGMEVDAFGVQQWRPLISPDLVEGLWRRLMRGYHQVLADTGQQGGGGQQQSHLPMGPGCTLEQLQPLLSLILSEGGAGSEW